jgi:hypothetical protein
MAHLEQFDPSHERQALERFDALAAGRPGGGPSRRRMRSNAATAQVARSSAAIAVRNVGLIAPLFTEDAEFVHHPLHTVHDRDEAVHIFRRVFESCDGAISFEPLAALGDSLALCHERITASSAIMENFDIGGFELEIFYLVEADEQARCRRAEFFAPDRLGDAIVRLYERHAELLPKGRVRDAAAATARTVAARLDPRPDLGRWTASTAPDVELVHHPGLVGHGSSRGRDAWSRVFRGVFETADAPECGSDEILALTPAALLVRFRVSGSDPRTGGGTWEQSYLMLLAFDPDGLVAREEYFPPDHAAEALARFDELVPSGTEAHVTAPEPPGIEDATTRLHG